MRVCEIIAEAKAICEYATEPIIMGNTLFLGCKKREFCSPVLVYDFCKIHPDKAMDFNTRLRGQ